MTRILRWLPGAAVLVLALAAFAYLIECGPGLVQSSASDKRAVVSSAGQQEPGVAGSTRPTIRIGWTAWSDAEVVTRLAERLLEERMGYRVELVMADIGIQYQAVANGDLDVMLMAWLPVTHSNYWKKVRGEVVNLGPLYTGRLGWVVPQYVPESELGSIEQLNDPDVARRVKHRIQGIDPGSGLMQASERAMTGYGLDDMKLVPASGAAMTAVLDRAVRDHKWVVVTAWQPHWIFARYKLRFLKDPKGILGGVEHIHAVARKGFEADFPARVTDFFARMYLPEDELAAILLDAQSVAVEEAVDRYIRTHPARIRYWVTGKIDE